MRKLSPLPVLLGALLLIPLPAVANSPKGPIPQVMIRDLQEDLDLSEIQAAAIIGNLAQETGNFTLLQQVGGPSFGYSQWLGPRKRAFFAYAEENGGRESYEANYGFLLHEIETEYPEMISRIRNSTNLDEATRIFMREFLRPSRKHANLPARVRYAQAYLDGSFDGAGCAGEAHVDGNRILPCPDLVVESDPPKVSLARLRFTDLLPRGLRDKIREN